MQEIARVTVGDVTVDFHRGAAGGGDPEDVHEEAHDPNVVTYPLSTVTDELGDGQWAEQRAKQEAAKAMPVQKEFEIEDWYRMNPVPTNPSGVGL